MQSFDFIHPLDFEMSEKVLNNYLVKKILTTIFDEQLDDINCYIHNTSEYKLDADHPAMKYLKEGCILFGVNEPPPIYITRTYQYDLICTGYNKPVIQIPNLLLENANERILRGRMMSAAASIKANHHKLQLLIWIIQNLEGVIPVPFATTAIRGFLYEWYRAQFYTADRAFYIATSDIELSLKNILYGNICSDILNNFEFTDTNNTYEAQVTNFFNSNTLIGEISKLNAFFQCESWLPARYRELQKYHKGDFLCQ